MRRELQVLACSIDTGADAVVNASNSDAVVGGGVSRALFDECGGNVLQREVTEKLDAEFDGELEPQDCLVTSGGTSKRDLLRAARPEPDRFELARKRLDHLLVLR